MKGPKGIHSQTRTVSVLDSRYNGNSLSACVPHSPWNIPNSQSSLLAFRASEDMVDRRENIMLMELMVRTNNTTIIHKMNCTVKSSCPDTNTVLGGYIRNLNIHLGSGPDKSKLPTPFDMKTDTKGPEEIHSQTGTVSILDSRYWNSLSACVPHSP